MKIALFLMIGLLSLSSAQADDHTKAAYFGIPLPTERVDSYLNGRALALTSENVLAHCVKNLQLTEKWKLNEEQAVKALAEKIQADRKAETDFIKVTVTGKNEKESKELLSGIINAGIHHFNMLTIEKEQQRLESLDNELQKQADVVQDYRKTLVVLIQQYGIPYFSQKGTVIGETELLLYRKSQERLDQLEQDTQLLKIKIDSLLNTSEQDLIRTAAGLELPENTVTVHYETYRKLRDQADVIAAKGLGPDHPEISSLNMKAEQAMNRAKSEVVSLKEVLKRRLQLAQKQVERLKERAHQKQSNTIDLSLQAHNYRQAAQEYEDAQTLLREMQKEQKKRRIELNMPISYEVHRIP